MPLSVAQNVTLHREFLVFLESFRIFAVRLIQPHRIASVL